MSIHELADQVSKETGLTTRVSSTHGIYGFSVENEKGAILQVTYEYRSKQWNVLVTEMNERIILRGSDQLVLKLICALTK